MLQKDGGSAGDKRPKQQKTAKLSSEDDEMKLRPGDGRQRSDSSTDDVKAGSQRPRVKSSSDEEDVVGFASGSRLYAHSHGSSLDEDDMGRSARSSSDGDGHAKLAARFSSDGDDGPASFVWVSGKGDEDSGDGDASVHGGVGHGRVRAELFPRGDSGSRGKLSSDEYSATPIDGGGRPVPRLPSDDDDSGPSAASASRKAASDDDTGGDSASWSDESPGGSGAKRQAGVLSEEERHHRSVSRVPRANVPSDEDDEAAGPSADRFFSSDD
jgi:hypothetical protein